MKRSIFLAFLLFAVPMFAHAQADLKVGSDDIRFSEETLVAGDQVRIYATVYNVGDEDVSGYLTFYQGASVIGEPVVVSLPAEGLPEEVFVDFVVPTSKFNILAMIQGTDPVDENSENNAAITQVIYPVIDDDRDGIENDQDNCPQTANASQTDTDGDGLGDECDTDDDNDSLSDDVELELGTDQRSEDTDGDGVNDPDDAYPTDPTKTEHEPEEETQEIEVEEQVQEVAPIQTIVQEVAKSIQEQLSFSNETSEETDEEVITEEQEEELSNQEIQISPNAVFKYQQDSWNTFTFDVLSAPVEASVYVWDFGDGASSSKASVKHAYTSSGAYTVTLTMTDPSGVVSTESTTILVPFFHLENRLVLVSLGLLIVLLVLGIGSFIKLGGKKK